MFIQLCLASWLFTLADESSSEKDGRRWESGSVAQKQAVFTQGFSVGVW